MVSARKSERLEADVLRRRRRSRARLHETALVCEHDRLRAVVQIELGEDACDVGLDRRVADEELTRDVAVRKPARDQAENLELASSELRERRWLLASRRPARIVLDQPACDRGSAQSPTGGDNPDCVQELVGAGVLEQEAA